MKGILSAFIFYKHQISWLFHKGTGREKALFWMYVVFSVGVLLYSYTQVDLGLVITRIPSLYAIEKDFQYVGYFNRPLSTWLFVSLIVSGFGLFLSSWYLSRRKQLSSAALWSIIGTVTVILTFSYNLLSYDLFNYIFDAKIVTTYMQNPYMHTALDFPGDPMLGFMHWTHRTYPYGPMWLVITVPLSYLGMHVFTLTFYLFKALMSVGYLMSVYFIYRLLQNVQPENVVERTIFFALNPLILLEFLVSGHNDIVMFGLLMWAVYLLQGKKHGWAIGLLIISGLVKFATLILLPAFLAICIWRNKLNMSSWRHIYMSLLCLMSIALALVVFRTQFQPWYLVYVLVFLPFVEMKWVRWSLLILSGLALLTYLPFLWYGDWNSPWYGWQEVVYYDATLLGALVGVTYVVTTLFRLLKV